MKIRDTFLIHESDGESMLVPTGKAEFSGLVRGNRTFGEILNLLRKETTEERIITELIGKYPEAGETIRADVRRALEKLRMIGALAE